MRHMIRLSPQELALLEDILNRPVRHSFGLWTGENFVYLFEQAEMEQMADIVYEAETESFTKWLNLMEEQEKSRSYSGHHEITQEMRVQWKYTGKLEEIFDRIAAPIGRSKRCSEKEAQEMLEYFNRIDKLECLEGLELLEPTELVEKLEGLEGLEGLELLEPTEGQMGKIWKFKKKKK